MRTVVFTICDRVEYLTETLKSWANVRGIEDWKFEFYVEPTPATERMLEVIVDWHKETGHPFTEARLNERRMGVLSNPHRAYMESFRNGSEFTMLAEEDVLVSTDILEYLEWCDRKWRSDPTVMGVACHTHADGPNEDVYVSTDFSPLGWGTWPDRWKEFDSTWDHDYSSGHGNLSGWDWNIKYRVLGDRKFAFPRTSRTVHIGRSGAHMQPQDFDASVSQSWVHHRPQVEYREAQ